MSLGLRAGNPTDRTIPIALGIIGFLIVTAGAYIGGDVVYLFGNMVNRHAWRGAGSKWVRLDTGDVTDLATLPEATPAKAKAGINDIVLVRIADTVYALHAVCAHAGGPLAQGTVVDGCIECPWHALALPAGGRARPARTRRCTTSPPTRSAPPRAVATRSGAPRPDRTGRPAWSIIDPCPRSSSPTRAWSCSIGAAGAGKSTFAARHFAPDEVLSSDRFRRIVSGDEANQAATKAAFAVLHEALRRRLAKGRTAVVDATSIEPSARRALLARAAAAGIPASAIVLDLPAATVLARNAARPARVVDMAVVRRQLDRLRASLDGPDPALWREGLRPDRRPA